MSEPNCGMYRHPNCEYVGRDGAPCEQFTSNGEREPTIVELRIATSQLRQRVNLLERRCEEVDRLLSELYAALARHFNDAPEVER